MDDLINGLNNLSLTEIKNLSEGQDDLDNLISRFETKLKFEQKNEQKLVTLNELKKIRKSLMEYYSNKESVDAIIEMLSKELLVQRLSDEIMQVDIVPPKKIIRKR